LCISVFNSSWLFAMEAWGVHQKEIVMVEVQWQNNCLVNSRLSLVQ